MSSEYASRPGDVQYFTQIFTMVVPHNYFDISVRSALHSCVIAHSALLPGFAALMERDAWHRSLVEAVGDVFLWITLVFGFLQALRCFTPLLGPLLSVMVFLLVQPSVALWSD